ncbi:MAG TPA: PKD domain-containing protein [Solirubrobacteraceae bacterium]|nr:PKD domain-containing protein [Solirubrobacteraceae bacterium]
MTIFARLPHLRDTAPARTLRFVAGAVAASAASFALLTLAPPARAVVTEVEANKVGLQGVNQASFVEGTFEQGFNESTQKLEAPTTVTGPLSFRNTSGNPVVHGANTYVIYWDPTASYNPDWQHLINTFMQSMGAASGSRAGVFAVDEQYTDLTNKPAYYQSTFHVSYTDTHQYPAKVCPTLNASGCLTDAQVRAELNEFIVAHGLPTGMGTIYYMLTPPGVSVCVDAAGTRCTDFERSAEEVKLNKYDSVSFHKAICSYHSAINPGASPLGDGNTILYGVVPWVAGRAGRGTNSLVTSQAAYCQDGGWNPSSHPSMEREQVKTRNAQEEKEFEAKTPVEREELEKLKALQGPHIEEPNQLPCPNLTDGYCDAGLADVIAGQIAIEQQNIVTNPLLNAWRDSEGKEATDQCRNFFLDAGIVGGATASPESGAGSLYNQTLSNHHYYLQMAFNLAAYMLPYPGLPCMPGANVIPEFTAPNTVNNGETVGFDGMESNITLNAQYVYSGGVAVKTYSKYKWEFGDGTSAEGYAPGAPSCETPWLSPCAASVFHSYQYGGTYQITLTATDTAGNVSSVTHPLVVNGPPPPVEAVPGGSTPGSAGGGATTTPGGGGGGGGGSHAAPVPPPVAAAAVVSRSLRRVLRNGLVVRYSVNEQVAGRFEVLLSRATARRLGIGGAPAFGLPAGTPPQVVIGKAILVTTAAGRSSVTIQFSKRTASKLAKLHSVPLLLRLFVRNASSRTPVTTTVLTSVTLSG